MPVWGEVEPEPEVSQWLLGLSGERFGRVRFYIDLLEEVERARQAMVRGIAEGHTAEAVDGY